MNLSPLFAIPNMCFVSSLEEFKKAGLDTAKSVLEQDIEDLIKRTDLEEETILAVRNVLKAEFSG